ncbi:MAG: hypothetical protein NT012_02255 [Candidatus Nealsonbacteria bacterium]|nr:hypothetical protein [Candidatus Nealsonbacteria bacterium]
MSQINKLLASSFPISVVPLRLKLSLGSKFLWIFIILIIFSLLIVFIYQLNAYASEVYFIQSSEKKISEFTQENKTLGINFAKANSLWNIGNYVQNFEKAGKIEYIRVLESTVLAK